MFFEKKYKIDFMNEVEYRVTKVSLVLRREKIANFRPPIKTMRVACGNAGGVFEDEK
jgi:hypothetical protein